MHDWGRINECFPIGIGVMLSALPISYYIWICNL